MRVRFLGVYRIIKQHAQKVQSMSVGFWLWHLMNYTHGRAKKKENKTTTRINYTSN